MQRSHKLQMGHGLLLAAWLIAGHDDVSAQTVGTYPQAAGTAAPTTADQQAPQQTSSTPAPTTASAPRDGGNKIDPVQAAKTIYNIFGKQKKQQPQPTVQTSSTPQAETPALEPTVAAPVPAQVDSKPTPKTVFAPRSAVKPIADSPAVQPIKNPTPSPTQGPVEQNVVQEPLQQQNAAPADSSAVIETLPTPVKAPTLENVSAPGSSGPDWPLMAALLALTALVAAGLKWFFFPNAHLDLEFETGDNRLITTTSPFVTLPDATFDVEFEWGFPSAPDFTQLQAGRLP